MNKKEEKIGNKTQKGKQKNKEEKVNWKKIHEKGKKKKEMKNEAEKMK